MSERTLTCAAMPLRADQSAYALVIGTREGMARLLGGQTEKLERRIDPAEWALKTETQCVIGDESASVALAADDADDPQTLAGQIVRLLRGLECRINLIRFHQIPDSDLRGADELKMEWLRDYLTSHGIFTTIRASRGQDIYAACGLLSTAKHIEE